VATLTVVLPTTPYESRVLALNPVAYWRLGETDDPSAGGVLARDYWGGFNGTYGVGAQNAFNGIAGPGVTDGFNLFSTTNGALQCVNNTAGSFVTTPALNFSGNSVTITGWVYPTAPQVNWSAMIFNRSGAPATGLNISGGGNLGYHWNDSFWNVESGLVLPNDQWSFIALAVQPTQATLYLANANGRQTFTNVAAHSSHTFGSAIRIGGDSQGDGRTFNGRLDEVAVFNQALSYQQIIDLTGNITLNIQPAGANVALSWPVGTLLEASELSGPWTTNNAASPYIVSPTAAKRFYRVLVQ
jgi:hypothetical protein